MREWAGLNLRTIQRLESGSNFSSESLKSLAAVFEVPVEQLLANHANEEYSPLQAIRDGFARSLDFAGRTSRRDFWWLALAITLTLAVFALVSGPVGALPLQLASLAVLLPWISACTKRLRDSGLSPWWQLISLVPVAGVPVLLYLLTLPTKLVSEASTAASH